MAREPPIDELAGNLGGYMRVANDVRERVHRSTIASTPGMRTVGSRWPSAVARSWSTPPGPGLTSVDHGAAGSDPGEEAYAGARRARSTARSVS